MNKTPSEAFIDRILRTPITSITFGKVHLNTRIQNIFRREGITTLGGLLEYSETELMIVRGLNSSSMSAIRTAVAVTLFITTDEAFDWFRR